MVCSVNVEKITIECLEKTLAQGAPFDVSHLDAQVRRVKALGLGVLRHYFFYAFCVNRYASKKTPLSTRLYLMVAMFQLDETKSPEKLVNTLVEKAKDCHVPSPMVNAILRKYLLERGKLRIKTRGRGDIQYNIRQSLFDAIRAQHEHWREWLTLWKKIPNVCLRINTMIVSTEMFLAALQKLQIDFLVTQEGCVILREKIAIPRLPGYSEGWFIVISESNQKTLEHLPPIVPKKVLDACSAPGGKAFLLRERYGQGVQILATDRDPKRIQRLEENNLRLKLGLTIQAVDWEVHGIDETFDLVWADVPCSATGVIGKHPEIAVVPRNDLQNITIQRKLLTKLWSRVSPGGFLVYTTCSVLKEENEEQVAWLLSQHDNSQYMQHGQYFVSQESLDIIYFCLIKKTVN